LLCTDRFSEPQPFFLSRDRQGAIWLRASAPTSGTPPKHPGLHRQITAKTPQLHRDSTVKSPQEHRGFTVKTPYFHRRITVKTP
jgi:hypothetical protein